MGHCTASTVHDRGGCGAGASGVREKVNGATATGASPSTPPARRKAPRARLCSLATNSSGVWIGASGTPRARASAKTSARVRVASASPATARIASWLSIR